MANPGLGGVIQPQTGATQQGLPPTTPQAHQELSSRWMQFFTNPAIQAGLAQFGASMLANVGSNRPFAARAGLATSDALRTVGGAAKFQADQQSEVARQAAEQERLRQGREGLGLERSGQAQRGQIAEREAGFREKDLGARTADNAAERALKEKELLSNDAYRKMMLGLQKEQLQSSILGLQTPRGRGLLALQKNILDSMAMDPDFDVEKAVTNGMAVLDQMFGPDTTPAPGTGAAGAPPAGIGAAPGASGAAAPGGPTPDAPLEGAIPFAEAAAILKATPPEDLQMAKQYFDQVYGAGQADKVLGGK